MAIMQMGNDMHLSQGSLAGKWTSAHPKCSMHKRLCQVHELEWGVLQVGTFSWAAPEVLLGKPCTEKVDIYSYGVLLWELSAGEAPPGRNLRPLKYGPAYIPMYSLMPFGVHKEGHQRWKLWSMYK